jgi:selenophosphate synthetase-related protein
MSLALQFAESEAKILLESLIAQERHLLHVCETSDDEDAVADAGNDLVELRLLLNRVRDAAIAQFGNRVLQFSREAL